MWFLEEALNSNIHYNVYHISIDMYIPNVIAITAKFPSRANDESTATPSSKGRVRHFVILDIRPGSGYPEALLSLQTAPRLLSIRGRQQ